MKQAKHSPLNSLPDNIQQKEMLYDGPIFQVHQLEIQEGEKIFHRDLVHHHPVVAILALTPDNKIILVEQMRHVVNESLLELPAGIREVDDNGRIESALDCGKRELEEECGHLSQEWQEYLSAYSSPGFTDEHVTILCAHNVYFKENARKASDSDAISWQVYSPEEVKILLKQGKIQDMKTYLAIIYWLSGGIQDEII